MREYAGERLRESGEAEEVRTRHLSFFVAHAEELETRPPRAEYAEALQRFEAEHDNLRSALAWAEQSGAAGEGVRLAGALGEFWAARGYLTEGRQHLTTALARALPLGP